MRFFLSYKNSEVTATNRMKLEVLGWVADDESSLIVVLKRRLGMPQHMKAFIAAAAISFGLAAPLAHAQTTAAVPPAPSVIEPSPQQLDQYAAVAQQVALVAADYQPKLESATDDAARQALMREADDKMVDKVQSGGLSVEEYNGISLAIQQDPNLQEQVKQRIATQK